MANASFEDTVQCPHSFNQIDRAVNWHASRESPDYFNECDFLNGVAGVPSNSAGYQFAHSGVAYCGFIAYYYPFPNTREYFTCQLINALTIGTEYFVSFFVSWSAGQSDLIACNKMGCLFSTNNFTISNNPAQITNYCQIYTDSIISDSLNWVQVSGSFIADSNYSFLTLGNFFDDSHTDTLMPPFPSAGGYYFIDDILVTEDTTTIVENISGEKNIKIYPNPTNNFITINLKNLHADKLFLLNSQFQSINEYKLRCNSQIFQIDCSNLSIGIYFLKINYTDKNSTYHKLIKL